MSIIPSQRRLKLRKDHLHTSYGLTSLRLQLKTLQSQPIVTGERREKQREREKETASVITSKGCLKGTRSEWWGKEIKDHLKTSLSLDISSFSFSRLFLSERRALTFPVCWQICFSLRSPPLFSLSFCLLLFPLPLTACLSLSLSFLTPSWQKIKDKFKGRRKVCEREKTIQNFQQDTETQHWWLKHYNLS